MFEPLSSTITIIFTPEILLNLQYTPFFFADFILCHTAEYTGDTSYEVQYIVCVDW